ncbi:hypothetical protein J9317_00590 [Metabacillus sp. KIGAM252]|uniref:Uncharacterized protein n=1 Tax=Metabacillus flavus TaxID=2823519 RepID=A0ABS5L993_9BACI|nr:hypothetical protein [Metabacillus flavus]MBS2967299.1 hypothetical protein [Metabacillus flavus]
MGFWYGGGEVLDISAQMGWVSIGRIWRYGKELRGGARGRPYLGGID